MSEIRIGRIIRFLADVKSEICIDGRTGKFFGGCGYIAAMQFFDCAIRMLTEQQTAIENLENLLCCERQEIAEYHRLYGDLEDCNTKTE